MSTKELLRLRKLNWNVLPGYYHVRSQLSALPTETLDPVATSMKPWRTPLDGLYQRGSPLAGGRALEDGAS